MKHTMIKGLLSLVAVGVAYIDKTFGELVWVLIALIAIDLILNLKDEGKQLNKIGSAAVALGLPSILTGSTNLLNPLMLHSLVAVMVLAYLQVVYPQIQTLLSNIGKKSANVGVQALDTVAQAKLNALEQQVQTLAQTQSSDYHLPNKP